jgi:hypothetical protein
MEKDVIYEDLGLLEFSQKFSTEESCREHLFKMRWPDRFICPRCGCVDYSYVLPWVHSFIRNVKSSIQGIFHGVSGKHLQRFLDECCYRFNRRFREPELFDRLLLACSRTMTVTYAGLVG